jgi:LCP family protein required for cell wall assembly
MPTPDQFATALEGQPAPTPAPRRRRPVRRWRWGRIIAIVLVVALVATAAYGVILFQNVAKISTQPLDFSGLATDTSGRTNVLLLGQGDPGHAGEGLTDTIMVLSIDSHTNRVAQISLPRDLRVNISGYGTSKINAANAYGGIDVAVQTVSQTLDIPIHYYIKTNFGGLKDLVDAVGGIDVDVKERLADPEYPCDDNQYKSCGLVIEPGLQHMNGTRALQYVRCRKGTCGNDFGRAARQQEVIGLVRQKLVQWQTLLNPAKLTPVTAALHSGVTTDMGTIQMLLFARIWQQSQNNQPIRLVLHTGTGGYLKTSGTSDLVPVDGTFAAIQDRVQNIFTEPTAETDLPEQ